VWRAVTDTAVGGESMFEVISPSKVADALSCPRKFFYKHIIKEPYEPTRAMIDGRNLHTAMEHFFRYIDPDEITADRTRDHYETYFSTMLVEHLPRRMRGIPHYREVLTNFAKQEARMLIGAKKHFNNDSDKVLEHWYPMKTEKKLKSLTVKLSGIVDRVDRLFGKHDGELVIIDYKTGNAPKPKEKQQKDGTTKLVWEIPSKIRRQMAFYKMLVEDQMDIGEVHFMCVFYPLSLRVIFEEIKKITITYAKRARDKAIDIANAGETIEDFPPKVGSQCLSHGLYRGCLFYETCRKTWTEEMLLASRKYQSEEAV
jgi:hypothetical protein